jgi:hypothetical protein
MAVRVGDVGRARSALSPSGVIEIDGVRLDARSDGTYIEAGATVVVLRGDPTGYVVREHKSGSPPLPNHGEPIGKPDAQMRRAEAEAAANNERRESAAELRRRVRRGATYSAVFGVVLGAASAWLGWYFDWSGVTGVTTGPVLVAGSVLAGAVAGVVLYFVTGVFVARVLPSEDDAVFEPSYFGVALGLVGAAVGFWLNFPEAGVGLVAAWSAGLAVAFAAVTAAGLWVTDLF